MLQSALDQGYQFDNFTYLPEPNIKAIYLRHDIDFCLKEAEKICKIESDLGIHSTYFILFSAATYNPLEIEQRKVLDCLVDAGQHFGLHIEFGSHFSERLAEGVALLELLTGKQINTFSLHNPTKENIAYVNEHEYGGLIFTYNPAFSKDIAYITDSNQSTACPCRLLNTIYAKNIQLLIHPLWWQEKEERVIDLIDQLIEKRREDVRSWFMTHNRIYKDHAA